MYNTSVKHTRYSILKGHVLCVCLILCALKEKEDLHSPFRMMKKKHEIEIDQTKNMAEVFCNVFDVLCIHFSIM